MERPESFEELLQGQRSRLVGLCARLTGNGFVAEDLAQEALLEAWRHHDKLRDPQRVHQWLSGIARNVCRRWRQRSRTQPGFYSITGEENVLTLGPDGLLTDGADLEIELEHDELADLLDRAMEFLSSETRAILIQRYIEDRPYAEIAERLGVSEGAVRVKLHRSKLALRRVLSAKFTEDAVAYGLRFPGPASWEVSRIWCPICGRQRLIVRIVPERGEFMVRCPTCHESGPVLIHVQLPDVLSGVKGQKAALNRVLSWNHSYVQDALARRPVSCPACGHYGPAAVEIPEDDAMQTHVHVAYIRCRCCARVYNFELSGCAWVLPAARRFWQQHPQMRTWPSRRVEVGGETGLATRFESAVDSSYLEVILVPATFRVLGVRGTSTRTSLDD